MDAPAKYVAEPPSWAAAGLPFWQAEIADRAQNKQRFSLDTYALLRQELPLRGLIQSIMYWYSLFSHQRGTLAWKGFAALVLDPADSRAALAALGSA